MQADDVRLLFDHLYWMRDRILDAADGPDVPFTDDAPVTIRDLRSTLVHELDVQWSWRERLRRPERTSFDPDKEELVPADFLTVGAIRTRWHSDEAEMRAWPAAMTDEMLNGPCGAEHSGSHPFWFHLQHLYTHGIQQFSEAAVLLTAAQRSPGNLDWLAYVEWTEGSTGS